MSNVKVNTCTWLKFTLTSSHGHDAITQHALGLAVLRVPVK